MESIDRTSKKYVAPWARVAIMMAYLAFALILARILTGSFLPEDPIEALIFQGALLLIVLGSSIVEYKYTKPADSVINALTAIITLLTVYVIASTYFWWIIFIYCLVVFILATTCTVVSTGKNIKGWRKTVAEWTYRPAVLFGQARLIFSIVFLFGILTFYGLQSIQTIVLVLFWGLFVVIWPLGIPEFISSIKKPEDTLRPIGQAIRIDWPNIVRATIDPSCNWDESSPKIFKQVDGNLSIVIPLYSQLQEDQLIGTGLCINAEQENIKGLDECFIYETDNDTAITESDISEALEGGTNSKLVGFVIEESTIPEIKFEIWDVNSCKEGMMVWCKIGTEIVYYQITDGTNVEETFQRNRHGFQVASAAQLGIMAEEKGFIKHQWLPRMNTPIFSVTDEFSTDIKFMKDDDFSYGTFPGTGINVGGPFSQNMEFHTAILGVTGSGKTELAFDLIRNAVEQNIKVVCIDLTAKYLDRLNDLSPNNLSIEEDALKALDAHIFAVDTGAYGAGEEKKKLKKFAQDQRDVIEESVINFLMTNDDKNRIGIITLEEISNTKATLYITELYLTCLLHYAKDHPDECPRVLIVVEEAHTVMPEPSTVGLGDYESKGLVSKIAQIALQGRKYGVGLLVVAQRTATVSKSVLTQCNTTISFTCIDDTSLNFLKNVYGQAYTKLIPELPPLNAIIFGKGLRSQRPLIIEIPFDERKVEPTGKVVGDLSEKETKEVESIF